MAYPVNIPEGLISETEIFDSKTPITKIIPAIKEYDAVIVEKDNDYCGIIDSREIYKSIQGLRAPRNQSAGNFVKKVPRITDSTTIDDVIYYFYKARSKALPYTKNNKIKGILKRVTLLKMLLSTSRLDGIKVGDAMVAPVIGINIDATVSQARAAMRGNKINRLIVLDNEKFAGIVTNYDLIDKYAKSDERLPQMKSYMYNPSNITLESVVQKNPLTIEREDSLDNATRMMVEKGVSSLVVLHKEKPVGILTELDLIESAMARGTREETKIFLSGLDAYTYEYEDEIREMLRSFMSKAEKISKVSITYISVVVKRFKTKSYDLHARLALAGSGGIINAHASGHMFERTMSDLLGILEKEIKRKKERYLTVRKVLHNAHAEEEE